MYEYTATILRVVDGDTVHADVDLGCDIHMNMTIRLFGINAPEMKTPEGRAAEAFLGTLIPEGTEILLVTHKDKKEKYGRYLGDIFLNSEYINKRMIQEGHAVSYMT